MSGEQGSDFLHPQGCGLLSDRQTPPISDCFFLAILGGTSGCVLLEEDVGPKKVLKPT